MDIERNSNQSPFSNEYQSLMRNIHDEVNDLW